MCYVKKAIKMSEKWLKKLDKVYRWMPSVVRACFSILLIEDVIIYMNNDVEFTSFFAGIVSLTIVYFVCEHIFIWDRLDKLERGKNGA